MIDLIEIGKTIFRKEDFLSLTYYQKGYYNDEYKTPIYEYRLCLKNQPPIYLTKDEYYELKRKLGEH